MNLLGTIESTFSKVNATVFRQVNRATDWWNLPTPVALLNLRAHRDDLREQNLYDTEAPRENGAPTEDLPPYRTYDGSHQDPIDPRMGMVGSRFGRNAPTDATAPEPLPERMQPSPREVANRLLLRDEFKPATSLNVLAACWIQFQNHDWFGHGQVGVGDPARRPRDRARLDRDRSVEAAAAHARLLRAALPGLGTMSSRPPAGL